MLIQTSTAKRLGIFFFYDAQGTVDEYVFYFLERLAPFLRELLIVCNGAVEEPGLSRLKSMGTVLLRENTGFDVGAYRAAMERFGYERLAEYDELLLTNSTVFGPLYPFEDLFDAMDSRDLDFWGITSHAAVDFNPFPQNRLKTLPEHIQSFFLAVRAPVLASNSFRAYWDAMPPVRSYEDSISYHEALFTRHFSSLGFRWATYTGTEEMASVSAQPIITMPADLVRDSHCPLIKRRSFFQDYSLLLEDTNGDPARKLLDYIRDNTDYPTELIWQNLLRTCNHEALRENLELNFLLPDRFEIPGRPNGQRVALWMHIYYMDMAEECLAYARSVPEEADVLVSTDKPEKKECLEKLFSSLPVRQVKVFLVENRGRDNSAFLVGFARYWQDYDVVCFAHDKKIRQARYETQGRTFSERCFRNTLGSGPFVRNVLATFAAEPRLGVLCPPPPNTSIYYNAVGFSDWGLNFENTKQLHEQLGLRVPIDEIYPPVAPFGFVFWFRPSALRRLFEHRWRYEDFPEEPVRFDGTFLHAVERIIPFAAQQEGYFSGWLLSESFAAVELTNYHYMLRQLNLRLIPKCGTDNFRALCARVERLRSGPVRTTYYCLKSFLERTLSAEQYAWLKSLKRRITNRAETRKTDVKEKKR